MHVALRQRGWSQRTRYLSHVSVSYSIPFFYFFTLFFGSRPARTDGPILTTYTLYDVFPHKEVSFYSRDEIIAHLWGQIPPPKKTLFWKCK